MKKIFNTNILIFLPVFFLTFLSCSPDKTGKSGEHEDEIMQKDDHNDEHEHIVLTREQFEFNNMKWGKPEMKTFVETVTATGQIDVPPKNREIISSFYGGTVKKLDLLVGSSVRPGMAVLWLENPEFVEIQKNYAEVKTRLDFLKNEFERTQTLYEENITSKKKYLETKSRYEAAVAEAGALGKQLRLLGVSPAEVMKGHYRSVLPIRTKIRGYVSKIHVATGSRVEPHDPIMEIINPGHVHVELNVYEKDALKIKKGQKILFRFTQNPAKVHKAKVHLIGYEVDPGTRTVRVHGHPEEHENNYPVGMFVDAKIITGEKMKPALPEESFVEKDGKWHILVLKKQEKDKFILEPVEVKRGETYEGYTELLTDLPKDAQVLTYGAFMLMGEGSGHEH